MKIAIAYAALLLLCTISAHAQLTVPSYERQQPLFLCGDAALEQELTVPFDLINTGSTDLLIDSAVAAGDTTEFYSNRDMSTGGRYLNPVLWHFLSGKTLIAGSSAFAGLSFTPKSSGDKRLTITLYYHDGTAAKSTQAAILFHTVVADEGIGFLSTRVDTIRYDSGGYAVAYDRVLRQDTLFMTDTLAIGDSLTPPTDPLERIYLTSCGEATVTSVDVAVEGAEEDLFVNSTRVPPFMLGSADTVPILFLYRPFSVTPRVRAITFRYSTSDGRSAVLKLTVIVVDRTSGVEEDRGDRAVAGSLISGSPNPFTGSTTIGLRFAGRTDARLTIVNALGREVALLHDGPVEPGAGLFRFDASGLPAGVYFARLQYGGRTEVHRLVLVR